MSDESAQSEDIEQPDQDALESWEDGPAFGVSQDKDPVCETPVEEWILTPRGWILLAPCKPNGTPNGASPPSAKK